MHRFRYLFFYTIVFFSLPFLQAAAQTLQSNLMVTDGAVNTTALSQTGDTLYIGGSFTYVGPYIGSFAAIEDNSNSADASWPKVNGSVRVAVSDGSGGWYIGGTFTTVGAVTRNRIAHIKSDKTLDTDFNPNASSDVYALAVSGTTVYAGGNFTTIGGQSRNRIAALSSTDGTATSWNPNASALVNAIAVSGTTVYAGGDFTTIGGQTRNRIAALDASTGNATSWDPNAGNTVNAITVSGTTVYAGGSFTTIGGQSRNYIAALSASDGTASSWNPNAGHFVYTITVSGSTVYAGGSFTTIGGQTRNRIAALDASTGTATSWNPNAGNTVWAIAVSGTTVYAGGNFVTIGGQTRNRIAALDASTGTATSWNPNASALVRSISLSTSQQKVYIGGDFSSVLGDPSGYRLAGLTNPEDIALPVELLDFDLIPRKSAVRLQWVTGSEVDNAGFEIFRSQNDSESFKKIASYITSGDLRGLGSSPIGKRYSYDDTDLRSGHYTYKLVDVAYDGTRKEHEPKSVVLEDYSNIQQAAQITPNPVQEIVTVDFTLETAGTVTLEVYSSIGEKLITTEAKEYREGNHKTQLPVRQLSEGMYIIKVITSDHTQTASFVIAR